MLPSSYKVRVIEGSETRGLQAHGWTKWLGGRRSAKLAKLVEDPGNNSLLALCGALAIRKNQQRDGMYVQNLANIRQFVKSRTFEIPFQHAQIGPARDVRESFLA